MRKGERTEEFEGKEEKDTERWREGGKELEAKGGSPRNGVCE